MTLSQQQIIDSFVKEGFKRLNAPKTTLHFGTPPESEKLLNDIEMHPHFFVLGCVMDRQIKAEKAWVIPYLIGQEIKSFEYRDMLEVPEPTLIQLFEKYRYHRFNKTMAICFYQALQSIHTLYQDNTANIWNENPTCKEVVNRLDSFRGVGEKIANMAVNILIRDFKVPMRDYSTIDIPPDSQVKKFFVAHGFVEPNATPREIIIKARELYPEYPGILDIAWEEGRKI